MSNKGICNNCNDTGNLKHGLCNECLNGEMPDEIVYGKQNPIETAKSHQIGAKWIGKDSKTK